VVGALRLRRLRLVDPEAQAREHRAVLQVLNTRLAGVGLPARPAMGGTVNDGVRYLRNRGIAQQRLIEVASQEQHEHLTINTEQVFDVSARSVGAPATRAQAERGLRFRVLGQPPADRDTLHPDSTEHLINGTSYQYRESPLTPMKLFICDHRVAMFPVDPLDFERGYLEVSQPTVVSALVGLFEKHWDAATDPQLDSVPVITLSNRERDLIRLLALGHTDLTAARNLRISARSVTNVLRALMDRLGVENRFQLGLTLGAMRIAVPPSLDSLQVEQEQERLAEAS
jgi:DNA-binding CsgD family transcriptional regulator